MAYIGVCAAIVAASALPSNIVVPANSEIAVPLRAKPSKVNSAASNRRSSPARTLVAIVR